MEFLSCGNKKAKLDSHSSEGEINFFRSSCIFSQIVRHPDVIDFLGNSFLTIKTKSNSLASTRFSVTILTLLIKITTQTRLALIPLHASSSRNPRSDLRFLPLLSIEVTRHARAQSDLQPSGFGGSLEILRLPVCKR